MPGVSTTSEETEWPEVLLTEEVQEFVFEMINEPTWYRFVKLDDQGCPLADCHFQVLDAAGQVVDEWVTDAAGTHELMGRLQAGQTYCLREIRAPLGYEAAAVLGWGDDGLWGRPGRRCCCTCWHSVLAEDNGCE